MNFWLKHGHPVSAEAFYCPLSTHITVEPWYNKHLYNEVLGINERDSKIIYMKKDLDMTKPCYSKQILPALAPSLYRSSTVTGFNCAMIFFSLYCTLSQDMRHMKNINLVKALFYFTKILQVYFILPLYCKDRNRGTNIQNRVLHYSY